ncbi:MAG: DNA primase [bacterium]
MSSSSVEKIKERLSVVDVISSYLKVEKAGGNFKANCPFHNEKTPSFFISPARGSYYCFGCGAKGDIFSFVEQFEGLDFKGALKVLADRAGVPLESYNPKDQSEKDRLYQLMDAATLFYEREFLNNTEAQDYIRSRGITDETRKLFRIGYAPSEKISWRALSNEMRKKGFTDTELELAGLSKYPEEKKEQGLYDRFRDRIMFPISDTGGRVIAFSGRMLHDDGSGVQGKYINSPETPIFKKGSTLYGLDKAKFEIRKRDQTILVEGQMDLVLSHQAGFINTVASSGTALSDTVVADVERGLLSGLGQVNALSKKLVIAFDGDKAGLKATGRAERIALSLGMDVKVVKLPKDMDPADVIRKSGGEEWKKIIDGAMHIITLYTSILMEHPLSELARARAVSDKILPYVAVMPSAVERAYFIKEISTKTGIPESALNEDMVKLLNREQTDKQVLAEMNAGRKDDNKRGLRIEDRLFGILFWQETLSPPIVSTESLRTKLQAILGDARFTSFMELPDNKKNEQIFEVESIYQNTKNLEREIDELILNLEEDILGKAIEKIMSELGNAERVGDAEQIKLLLTTSQEIANRLNIIKSSRFLNK